MRRIKIEIETENAAFQPEPRREVARILREAADSIESGRTPNIMDINGNKVGGFEIDGAKDKAREVTDNANQDN
jgi:hypothetical protein